MRCIRARGTFYAQTYAHAYYHFLCAHTHDQTRAYARANESTSARAHARTADNAPVRLLVDYAREFVPGVADVPRRVSACVCASATGLLLDAHSILARTLCASAGMQTSRRRTEGHWRQAFARVVSIVRSAARGCRLCQGVCVLVLVCVYACAYAHFDVVVRSTFYAHTHAHARVL